MDEKPIEYNEAVAFMIGLSVASKELNLFRASSILAGIYNKSLEKTMDDLIACRKYMMKRK